MSKTIENIDRDYENFLGNSRSVFFTMRKTKCQKMFDDLETLGLIIIKSPPGSGKTFFGNLLKYYGITYLKKTVIFLNPLGNLKNLSDSLKLNLPGKINKIQDIIDTNEEFTLILDETQLFYKIPYLKNDSDNIWNIIKACSEKNKKNVKIILIAMHSIFYAPTSKKSTPLIFDNSQIRNYNSLLKFDQEELAELMQSYLKHFPEAKRFLLTIEILQTIGEFTNFHPHMTMVTIDLLFENFKDKQNFNIEDIYDSLNNKEYIKYLSLHSKSLPQIINKIEIPLRKLLIEIFLHQKIDIYDQLSENYKNLKLLEEMFFIHEINLKTNKGEDFFQFSYVNQTMASYILNMFPIGTNQEIPKIDSMNIREIAITAMRRLDLNNLKNIYNYKELHRISEEQWVFQFFLALKSMIPKNNFIFCQANKQIDKDFTGEIDLYVNGSLNLGFEFLIEGGDVVEHIIRKIKVDHPEFSKIQKYKKGGRYRFPRNAQYLVIEIRKSGFYKLKSYILDDDLNKIHTSNINFKQYLMRIVFNKDFSILQYTNEKDQVIGEIEMI